jgi:hypothetical protein
VLLPDVPPDKTDLTAAAPAPPAPIVIVMLSPGVTEILGRKITPPPPPPPPWSLPPPPPPATIKAVTFVTPVGTVQLPDEVYSTTVF